jgi:hypothetical protein
MKANLPTILALVIGAVIGSIGSTLVRGTLPPAEGSAEERVAKLEHELKKTRTELNALADTSPRKRFGASTTHEGVRSIAQAMRQGLPVTPDDIFNAFKPLMRDLSPLTERMRVLEGRRHAESLAGTYARKYGLGEDAQARLVETLEAGHAAQAAEISRLVESDHTSLREFMKAEREFDREAGIDAFMERNLTGEKLQAFQTDRMAEKSQRVQSDADLQVERIDGIVKLDDAQRDQMFLYMAQTSDNYDPRMRIEDLQGDAKPLPQKMSRQDAMLSVLRPEQRQTYEQHKAKKLSDAQQEAARLGLTIPHDWDPDDDIW